MQSDSTRVRAESYYNPAGPSQSLMGRLGTRLIQLGNAINDQDPSKWIENFLHFLRFLARQCVAFASNLRLSYSQSRRRQYEQQIADGTRIRPPSIGSPLARVERGNVLSREDASLEVFAAIEHERERIGRDLHDGLGQMFTAMGFMSSALHHSLRSTNHPGAADAEALSAMIHQTSGEAKKIVRGVAESPIEQIGLARALDNLCADVRRWFGVDCRFECDELTGPVLAALPLPVGTELFRIAQEAVTSAVRHANSTDVRVQLSRAEGDGIGSGELQLTIEDKAPKNNGRDVMVVNSGQGSGFEMGQEIMRCRARNIGATLEVRPGNTDGTIVICGLRLAEQSLPIEESKDLASPGVANRINVAKFRSLRLLL